MCSAVHRVVSTLYYVNIRSLPSGQLQLNEQLHAHSWGSLLWLGTFTTDTAVNQKCLLTLGHQRTRLQRLLRYPRCSEQEVPRILQSFLGTCPLPRPALVHKPPVPKTSSSAQLLQYRRKSTTAAEANVRLHLNSSFLSHIFVCAHPVERSLTSGTWAQLEFEWIIRDSRPLPGVERDFVFERATFRALT